MVLAYVLRDRGDGYIVRYEVTNPGSGPLADITVADDTCGPVIGPDPDGDNNPTNGLLDPGETWIYVCRYTVKTKHPNPRENRAMASGWYQSGDTAIQVTGRHPATVQIAPCPTGWLVREPSALLLFTGGLASLAGYVSFSSRRRLNE